MVTDSSLGTKHSPKSIAVQPYPASWADHLIAWVDRLPLPGWLFYLLVWIGEIGVLNGAQWLGGSAPLGSVDLLRSAATFYGVFEFALLHYFQRVARRALENFRPALDAREDEYARLEYELTTIPARGARIATVLGLLLMVVAVQTDPLTTSARQTPSLSYFAYVLTGYWGVAVIPILLYQTVRQLRLVSEIHRIAPNIDLFQPAPLYAFSGLTVRVALALMMVSYYSAATDPTTFTNPLWYGLLSVSGVLAAAFFILPLYGMHERIRKEKEKLQGEADKRLVVLLSDLHQGIDRREFGDADALNKTIQSLNLEREIVGKLPTWPWQANTIRGFLTALILPIVLWFITRLLERLLAF